MNNHEAGAISPEQFREAIRPIEDRDHVFHLLFWETGAFSWNEAKRRLRWDGRTHDLSEDQLKVIEALLHHTFDVEPGTVAMMTTKEINEACFPESKVPRKMRELFRSRPEIWGHLVVWPRKGFYSLNLSGWQEAQNYK